MYGCENWTIKLSAKELMLWSVVLEKTLESPLDYMEIQPVNPKGNQSWIFIGSTDAGAEIPILWPPDAKNWFIGKDPDAGKDWRREKKVTTEVEMVESHHQLSGHEVWVSSGRWWWTGKPSVLPSRRSQKVGIWLSNWTELNCDLLRLSESKEDRNCPILSSAQETQRHLFLVTKKLFALGTAVTVSALASYYLTTQYHLPLQIKETSKIHWEVSNRILAVALTNLLCSSSSLSQSDM